MWQSLIVGWGGGGVLGVGGSEKVILAWRDYWIASKYFLDHREFKAIPEKKERKIVSDRSDLLRDFLGRKPINKS